MITNNEDIKFLIPGLQFLDIPLHQKLIQLEQLNHQDPSNDLYIVTCPTCHRSTTIMRTSCSIDHIKNWYKKNLTSCPWGNCYNPLGWEPEISFKKEIDPID